MRRFAILFLCAALFLSVWNVTAAGDLTCDDGQKLFALSPNYAGIPTDAHGEVWSLSNYDFEICFDDYFRGTYLGANPHDCASGNVVLRLSGSTNAHAEAKGQSSSDYSNVCYGNLDCFVTTGNCNDSSAGGSNQYSLIVSLSDITNAHLSLTNIYPQRVCCRAPTFTPFCDYDSVCEEGQGETPQNCLDCQSSCGDGQTTGLEECDGNSLPFTQCADLGQGYVSGTLSCNAADCTYNKGNCKLAQCADGIDNDDPIDNAIDLEDFSCSDASDNDESNPKAQCQNGIDDDGDRFIDLLDEGCDSLQDNQEANCGDGIVTSGVEECELDSGEELCININDIYAGGTASCTDSCIWNKSNCQGSQGFCVDEQPFVYDFGGALLAPASCKDYNKVFTGSYVKNVSLRQQLCENDCVPGASDPVNNGYGGLPLQTYGCEWDPVKDECYFEFVSNVGDEVCRIDYDVTQECGANEPFRTVEITATAVDGGDSSDCVACSDGSAACVTQVACPRVVQLPLIGWFGILASVVVITGVYVYLKRGK